jgi:hypothetical protein
MTLVLTVLVLTAKDAPVEEITELPSGFAAKTTAGDLEV